MLSGTKIIVTVLLIVAALTALRFLSGRSAARRATVAEAARKATRARITDLVACPRCGTHTAQACQDPACPI